MRRSAYLGRSGAAGGASTDEFAAEFEQNHEWAQRARARTHRAAQAAEQTSSAASAPAAALPSRSWDAPPTSSLSAMLHATQPLRTTTASGSSAAAAAAAASAGLFSPARRGMHDSGSADSTPLLLSPRSAALAGLGGGGGGSSFGSDVSASAAHFSHLMHAQHQYEYRGWIAGVHHMRSVAAAVWLGVALIVLLHLTSLSYLSAWPHWYGLHYGWAIDWRSAPALAHWPSALCFALLQSLMLMLRAHAKRTDPSPLLEPWLLRLWRCVSQPRQSLTALVAAAATLVSGYAAASVLFNDSRVWNDRVTDGSAGSSFVLSALGVYALVHAFRLVFEHQSLLLFPVLRHQSRTRHLMQVFPALVVQAAGFAFKLSAVFAAAWWIMNRGGKTIDASVGEDVAAAVVSASPSLLSSLPAAYHVFLLVCLLCLSSLLTTAMLSIFLTQPLDFHHFFLHALYEHRTDESNASNKRSADQTAAFGGAAPLPCSDASINHLTNHLALHFLLDLSSAPHLRPACNALLFTDMNRLFEQAPADAIMLNGGSSSGAMMPSAQRSTLPHQPAFVPVLLFCLHHIRLMSESLIAQRQLSSYTPPSEDWGSAFSSAGGNGAGASAQAAALNPFTPRSVASFAFLSTQLDGGGLLFPSRSQLSARLFRNAAQIHAAVDLVSFLAVHALAESNVAPLAGGAAGAEGLGSSSLFGAGAGAASSPYLSSALLLQTEWVESILSGLLGLSLALEGFAHAPAFVSPAQESALQGHQLTRASCVKLANTVDSAVYRLVVSYWSQLSDFHLAPPYAARLQAYAAFAK